MAFKRAEASSLSWPPGTNVIPGTAAGTARKKHLTVALATSSTASCLGQVDRQQALVAGDQRPRGVYEL